MEVAPRKNLPEGTCQKSNIDNKKCLAICKREPPLPGPIILGDFFAVRFPRGVFHVAAFVGVVLPSSCAGTRWWTKSANKKKNNHFNQTLFGNVNLKTSKWRTKIYWKPISENTSMNNQNLLGIPWTPQLFPAVSTRVSRGVSAFFLCPNRRRKTMAELWDKGCQPRFNHHSWRKMVSSQQFFFLLIWLDLKFTAFKTGLACWSRLNKKKGDLRSWWLVFPAPLKKTCTCEIGNHLLDRFGGKKHQRNHLLVLLGKNNLWNHLLVC